ncbi:dnaJ domain-containing protein [Ditylenchus destructor]|uniref:DnaJ domain-containing protein n=1 Tax=Ditylenchus destructor TaxID=166010 RepID=A0AAD4QZ75_9BILA|nr:dnaJ domain-containing protein [Ditylenchus destructor]
MRRLPSPRSGRGTLLGFIHRGCAFGPGRPFSSSTSKRNPYNVLGLKKECSQEEIKNAFYTLSKKYHPDVAGSDSQSAQKFLEVKDAYDTLKDEDKPQKYPPYGNWNTGRQRNGYYDRQRTYSDDDFERAWRSINRDREEFFRGRGPNSFSDFAREARERAFQEYERNRQAKNGHKTNDEEKQQTSYRPLTKEERQIAKIVTNMLSIYFGLLMFILIYQQFRPKKKEYSYDKILHDFTRKPPM